MRWILLFSCTFFFTGITAVTINVTSPVSARLQEPEVTLPCDYELENPDGKFLIRWKIDDDNVLMKDSDGEVHQADSYKGRVFLGNACSLVLLKPKFDDSGSFVVRILAADDTVKDVTARVSLVVTTKPLTDGTSHTQPHQERTTTDKSSSVDEVGYLWPAIILLILSTICLAIQFSISIKDAISIRRDETIQQRNRRVCRYILSRAVFVLFIAVFVASAFGVVERNTAILAGSASTFIIAVSIQCFYMAKYMKLE
ncbi:uncharacterized protein LOC135462848 [Liolophura sinensis]|uniref:uncharacterized protein LOC135462848 n=1 Tax=Liolophura sinensis TaxID=3198878 RepID=UPI00315852AE